MSLSEFETAMKRLQSQPDATKAELGPKLNQYLNKLEDLRSAIQQGINSGPSLPADPVFDRLIEKYC